MLRCFAYQFNFDYHVTILLVLWALGWAMIALSVLVRFPVIVPTIFGAVLVLGHNLLDSITSTNPVWVDPALAWVRAQHACARRVRRLSAHSVDRRDGARIFTRTGLFVGRRSAARLSAAHGDRALGRVRRAALRSTSTAIPVRWSAQKSALFTVLSFLNTTKYPPSLLFLLMTLGPALVFLWAVDGATPRVLEPARIIGKVPMFYYVLHFALIHLLAVATCLVRYHSAHWMFESPDLGHYPISRAAGVGILAADRVSRVGDRRDAHVSALRVVRGAQAATKRCVAELPVARAGQLAS